MASAAATITQTALRLAVVVPLANEQDIIDRFLAGVTEHLGPDGRVFCVLDNASKDNTRAMVEAFGQKDPRVELVWAPQNRCVVDAYFRGYQAAFDAGAAWILEMDGGMSHQPSEIARYVALIDKGYDFVVGCRFMKGASHVGSIRRRMISWCGSVLTNLMLGTRMRDMTSGFEMFSRRAMEHILRCGVRSRANFFQTEIKYQLRNWKWIEVPINYRSTKSHVPRNSLKESLGLLWRMRREAKAGRSAS
jgi:dolichol-phosphate mannosyltransferase